MLAQKQWTTLCLATLLLLARSVLSSDEVVVAGVTIATVSHASLKIHHDNYEAVKYGPYKSGTDVWEGVEFDVQQITISPYEIEDFVDYSRSFSRFTRRMTAQQKDQFAEALGFAEFAKQSAKLTRSITIRENERTVAVMLLITKKNSYGELDLLMSTLHEDAITRVGLVWGKQWHANLNNQRMLEGWATYRLMQKLQDRHEL